MKKQLTFLFLSLCIIFQPSYSAILPASYTSVSVQQSVVSTPVKPIKKSNKKAEKVGKVNRFAKWGFIFSLAGVVLLGFVPVVSFLFLPAGLILSAIGLSDVKKSGERGKGLGLAGILLSSLGILFIVLAFLLVLAFLQGLKPY